MGNPEFVDSSRLLRLVSAFKKNGETLRKIGGRFGVDRLTVFKWTASERNPGGSALVVAAHILTTPVESDGLELGRDLDEVV